MLYSRTILYPLLWLCRRFGITGQSEAEIKDGIPVKDSLKKEEGFFDDSLDEVRSRLGHLQAEAIEPYLGTQKLVAELVVELNTHTSTALRQMKRDVIKKQEETEMAIKGLPQKPCVATLLNWFARRA